MTYFNPKIYNKYNLSPKDRNEVDFWQDMIYAAFRNARNDVQYDMEHTSLAYKKDMLLAQKEILDYAEMNLTEFVEEYIVSLIENYTDEEFEMYKAAGDKERAEKGISYEEPYASLKEQRGLED